MSIHLLALRNHQVRPQINAGVVVMDEAARLNNHWAMLLLEYRHQIKAMHTVAMMRNQS
jgi:hypothetical protein